VENPWYVGGTLHERNAKDWAKAKYRNRLATAADFAAANHRSNGALSVDPDELLPEAAALERCMSEVVVGQSTQLLQALSVRDLAAGCLVIMENQGNGA
jgi:hypothetical protein